jgi:hypothetical protein
MTTQTNRPGRSCPLRYRHGAASLNVPAAEALRDLEVLYVAGGLYGNDLALDRIVEAFDGERGRKRLLFNGDFHWFDVDAQVFDGVQTGVLAYVATRGNVETELCSDPADDDAGCGCAYPEWVDDDVVGRSNRILARLRGTATDTHVRQLAVLPPWLRAEVGDLRVAVVHGDAESLAGWGFAQEHLREPANLERGGHWFAAAGADAFACTHTCLPVFQEVRIADGAPSRWILNNGAAGMPNFRNDGAGLLTRIALTPPAPGTSAFGVRRGDVFLDAIRIEVDAPAAQQRFLAQWPPGSDAYLSYFARIRSGPGYEPHEALRRG